MSNEALDRRIAEEFMGWEPSRHGGACCWCKDGAIVYCEFNPTTDARAAYVVLEKIASKGAFEICRPYKGGGYIIHYVPEGISTDDGLIRVKHQHLALAISKLAEAILNSPEHMELFK